MTMQTDRVKYQLEKAQTALREALRYGYEELSPYQLSNITEALKEIDNAGFTLAYVKPTSSAEDKMWEDLKQRTIGNPAFKFHATTEFIPATK